MTYEFNVGDKVTLQIPGNNSPSNGMPGVIIGRATYACGGHYYEVKWGNGGINWTPKEWLVPA